MRVLILDGNPTRADASALSLSQGGFSVLVFSSPHQALERIHEVDILVTNYHLPDMTGLEVARRAYDQGWRGSLLLMSGHVGIQELAGALGSKIAQG